MALQHKAQQSLEAHRSFETSRNGSVFALATTALVALAPLSGCGSAESTGDAIDFERRSNNLFAINQPEVFKYISALPALGTGTGDGAMCTPAGGSHSKIIFTRDTSNFIQGISDVIGFVGPWGKYGGSGSLRQLGGRPACGFLSGSSSPYPFILLAKGSTAPNGSTDRRLFWSRGDWTTSSMSPPAPAAQTAWAAVSSTQFGTNGNPAVGTHDGQLVVVYLGDMGQLLANSWVTATSSFGGTVTGPTLPTGWTGVGTPAIHYAGSWSQRFTVIVRAKNASNQHRFYVTFFNGTSFQGALPGSSASYEQVILPANAPAIESDPAYEYDDDPDMNTATLYYRNGTLLYQVSANNNVYGFNESTILPITLGSGTPTITGSPLAIGGVPYEGGKHWLLARGGSNLYFAESFNDGNPLIADRAACADFAQPEEIFGDGHMVGCAGSVTWAQRDSLCAPGSFTCSASEWHSFQTEWAGAPAHNYWTSDELRYSGSSSACSVSPTTGTLCPSGQPMRVCTAAGSDPEGNVCNWSNCGYGTVTPNEYFGGCSGNTTAGTLCCR